MSYQRVFAFTLLACMFGHSHAQAATPLGLGFTYQGHLERNGVPENGVVHLRFSLWDAAGAGDPPAGGTQIGASQLLTNVPIEDGVFTVVLNAGGQFGATAFNGEGRWLQIEVCENEGCSSLTILNPRQPLTGTPYSLTTISAPWSGLQDVPAGFADGVDNIGDSVWQTNGANISYTTGAVGIGTTSPDTKFQINDGRLRLRESATLERWDLFYDPPSQLFLLQENAAYNHIVFTRGPNPQVGIGTISPNANSKVNIYADYVNHAALRGESIDAPAGITGIARRDGAAGIDGYNSPGGTGVTGQGATGVSGVTFVTGGVAVKGTAGFGVAALAGQFEGDVDVTGQVLKSGSATRIDHPLDPQNKFLSHSSVESPDMKNLYEGTVITDGEGYATVQMPEYFEAYNKDFRYQLTVLDESDSDDFVQAKVVKKIKANQFTIRTNHPNVEVSWQVTGVRNDAYAKAHPLEVEKVKSDKDRGKYLVPEVFGQPKEMGIHYRPEIESQKDKYPHGE